MSTTLERPPEAETPAYDLPALTRELDCFRRQWLWLLALGIALTTLGTVAVASSFFVSIVTVVMFGVLLLIGGVVQIVNSFWIGKWGGLLLHLLMGIFYAVVGVLIIDAPLEGAIALTLLVAMFLIVGGLFRIVSAMMLRFRNWGWPLLNGFVSLLLGILIYRQWPASGLWVIGLFVGIEMIFNGWSWVMLAIDVRSTNPEQTERVRSAERFAAGGVPH
ncbi:MAG: HdeD family acid-resistance protein [Pirellulales bacterium]|nr:HdeD family acid-resistance protein [Pirellulales bacterium]